MLVTNGTTYRIATVTDPRSTTVAITKTKEGKTRVVPVRILRTVTGPGGVETVAVQVLGPERTVTELEIQTQLQTQMQTQTQVVNQTQTQTEVIMQIQPTAASVGRGDSRLLRLPTRPLPPGPPCRLWRLLHSAGSRPPAMESSAQSYAPTAYIESAEATGCPVDVREGIGLGTLLILLSPLALAAWFAIGSAVYRMFT